MIKTSISNNLSRSFQAFGTQTAQTSFYPCGKEHSNVFFETVDKIGRFITKFAATWSIGFSRVFLLSLKAGFWGQKDSTFKEVIYRVALFILGIITVRLAFYSALVGGLLRLIASIDKKDFIYHKKDSSEAAISPTGDVKVLTFNVALMPEFVALNNCLRPTSVRVREVAEKILTMDKAQDLDFICLQEAFDIDASQELDNRLRGYNIVRNVGNRIYGLNSGLIIASKHDLTNIQFYDHPLPQSGLDKFANKGLLLATSTIAGKTYVIGNTHLNAGNLDNDCSSATSRAAQVIAIQSHIHNYTKKLEEAGTQIAGVILAGDTNICPTYYEGREKGILNPILEPEWLLSSKLFDYIKEKILHIPSNLKDWNGWKTFKTEIQQILTQLKADITKELAKATSEFLSTNSLPESPFEKLSPALKMEVIKVVLDKCFRDGGPFSDMFNHDLMTSSTDSFATNCLAGSTIDPHRANWTPIQPSYSVECPERVDFVSVHVGTETIAMPEIVNTQVLRMLTQDGRLISDHNAVLTTLRPTN